MEKRCFKCGVAKSLNEFYRHSQMGDGHLNKCKDCTRSDVQNNYAANRAYYAAYDKRREQTLARKKKKQTYFKNSNQKNPMKRNARVSLGNALRDNRVKRQPCEICGAKAQAHHEDYTKPFDVRWLCFKHHREHAHNQVTTSCPQ